MIILTTIKRKLKETFRYRTRTLDSLRFLTGKHPEKNSRSERESGFIHPYGKKAVEEMDSIKNSKPMINSRFTESLSPKY